MKKILTKGLYLVESFSEIIVLALAICMVAVYK